MIKKNRWQYILLTVIVFFEWPMFNCCAIEDPIRDCALQKLFFNHIGFEKTQKDVFNDSSSKKFLLFIIDFDSFMCFSCLDSLLDFYNGASCSFEEGMIWGILVFNEQKKKGKENSYTKIIEKKLRGFIRANNIKFPIIIDHFHIFRGLSEEGTAVVLFDQNRNTVKKYVFPLGQVKMGEILNSLRD